MDLKTHSEPNHGLSICNAKAKVYHAKVPQKWSDAAGSRRATDMQGVGTAPWKHSKPVRTQWTNPYKHTGRTGREGTVPGSNIPAKWGQRQS